MSVRSSVKKLFPTKLFKQVEPLGHWGEAVIEQTLAGFPAHGLKIIGVTGTDGKTTTCTLITQMLRNSGKKVAMMTTISVDYGNGPQPNPSRMTTLGSAAMIRELKKIRTAGVEWLVLETTSQALAQHRVWGIPYSVAVMTNLSHEHLDYHGTFERYRTAKVRLFKQANRNKHGLQVGISNADDPNGKYFANEIKNSVTYGVKAGNLKATNINLSSTGSVYGVSIGKDEYKIVCHLPGSFNVYNSLAALGVGRAIGLSKQQIEQGIASLQSVEGRMTKVDEGQDFSVIVDYAHTPDSFKKIYEEVRPLTKGRLITVFGSAGRRDETKRPEQGRVAGEYCDVVFVTEEDDRDMDGTEILRQIAEGAQKVGKTVGKDLFLVHDRPQAIEKAIKLAKKGDIVLLLGKGHEKSILSNGPKAVQLRHLAQSDDDPQRVIKRPYDEVSVARQALKKLQS